MALTGRDRIMRDIRNQKAFTVGNVRGEWINQPADIERGQLPRDVELPEWGPVFVVFSYRTPIAWWCGDTWTMPTVKYSATTTNHQRVTAQAVAASVTA